MCQAKSHLVSLELWKIEPESRSKFIAFLGQRFPLSHSFYSEGKRCWPFSEGMRGGQKKERREAKEVGIYFFENKSFLAV